MRLALGLAAIPIVDDKIRPHQAGDRASSGLSHLPVPGTGEEDIRQPQFYAADGEPKQIRRVPGSDYTGGLEAQPAEYERRVIEFLDRSLLTSPERSTR